MSLSGTAPLYKRFLGYNVMVGKHLHVTDYQRFAEPAEPGIP